MTNALCSEPYMMEKVGVNLKWAENTPAPEYARKVFKGVIVDLIGCQI